MGCRLLAGKFRAMNDYERIARIIRLLNRAYMEQPSLDALAAEAGLSPYHFHRLFSKWAGVTPKDFVQCLTVSHAKTLLRKGASVLEASLDAGLSGPGRLHDLCVDLVAATPGEWKGGGKGWTIHYGVADCPFGLCLLAEGPRGICHLSFIEETAMDAAIEALKQEWPQACWRHDKSMASERVTAIFLTAPGELSPRPIRALVQGTPFQVRVWRALLRIPEGSLVTYGQLARSLDCPKAARAVGSAVGHNGLGYLIPCHRVIRETGIVSGYRWGSERKQAMIAWESLRRGDRVDASD